VRQLDELDRACSRLRPDSELVRLDAADGRAVAISPLLAETLAAALRAAALTGGVVDPTVGTALDRLGYDYGSTACVPNYCPNGSPSTNGATPCSRVNPSPTRRSDAPAGPRRTAQYWH